MAVEGCPDLSRCGALRQLIAAAADGQVRYLQHRTHDQPRAVLLTAVLVAHLLNICGNTCLVPYCGSPFNSQLRVAKPGCEVPTPWRHIYPPRGPRASRKLNGTERLFVLSMRIRRCLTQSCPQHTPSMRASNLTVHFWTHQDRCKDPQT